MSSPLTPLRVETGLWLLLCGGLAGGIGVETDWGRQLQPPAIAQSALHSDFALPTLAEPFHLAPADSFLETAMRPLFVVSRRPAPPPPPPEPPKPAMQKDQFRLTGITIVPGGNFAFLVEKAGNRNRVVSAGKEINGIMVKEVSANQVVLTQFDESEILTLKTAKGPLTTVPATPPTPTTPPPAAPGAPAPRLRSLPPRTAVPLPQP
jgi:hypothetical protein